MVSDDFRTRSLASGTEHGAHGRHDRAGHEIAADRRVRDVELAGLDALRNRAVARVPRFPSESRTKRVQVHHRPRPCRIAPRVVRVVLDRGVGAFGVTLSLVPCRNERVVQVVAELDGEHLEQLLEAREVVVKRPARDTGGRTDLFDAYGEALLVADQAERGLENLLTRALALAAERRPRFRAPPRPRHDFRGGGHDYSSTTPVEFSILPSSSPATKPSPTMRFANGV